MEYISKGDGISEMDDFSTKILLQGLAGIIKEPVSLVIETWVKPKIEEIKKHKKLEKQIEEYFYDGFSNYICRAYQDRLSINIIALGNQQIKLNAIYEPLSINSGDEDFNIVDYNIELAEKYKKVLIEDSAGMGKSTIMKKLFTAAIDQNVGIPVFIELRRLSSEQNVLEFIIENMNSFRKEFSLELVTEIINRGDFIFFLDGFDEIPFEYKENVIVNLKSFISKAGNNIFFLTSRTDKFLSSFGDFKKFNIKPLKVHESYNLIQKYDAVSRFNLSEEMVKDIKLNLSKNSFHDLPSFLRNPFLVSLLYVTYKHKRDIPLNKDEFYRKVYDALFEEHDLSKDHPFKRGKHCELSKDKFHKLLRKLGFLCLVENKVEYKLDMLLDLIFKALQSPYFGDTDPSDVLQDLLENVPLFIKEGLTYRWAHKSFMEYFAANYVFIDLGTRKEEILKRIYGHKNFPTYINFLDFYFDVDPETFDRVFTYPLICDYLAYIGEPKQYKLNQLRLKQCMFNKAIYFTKKKEHIEKLINDISYKIKFIPQYVSEIENDQLFKFRVITYCENSAYNGIISILIQKDFSIFKRINIEAFELNRKASVILTCNDDFLIYDNKKLKILLSILRFTNNSGIYIDWEEAKKMKIKIEEEMNINDQIKLLV